MQVKPLVPVRTVVALPFASSLVMAARLAISAGAPDSAILIYWASLIAPWARAWDGARRLPTSAVQRKRYMCMTGPHLLVAHRAPEMAVPEPDGSQRLYGVDRGSGRG